MSNKDALDQLISDAIRQAVPVSAHPGPCPEPADMALYIDGLLGPAKSEEVESHLYGCGDCRGILVSAHEAYRPGALESVDPAVIRRSIRRITGGKADVLSVVVRVLRDAVELVQGTFQPALQPVPAFSPRGKAATRTKLISLQKRFDGVVVDLDVEKTGPQAVEVSLLARRPDGLAPYPGLRASLFQGGRERCSLVMEDGAASFENLPPTAYAIMITRDKMVLGQVDLKIEGAVNE